MTDQARVETGATERVLAAMLAETLALMEDVAAVGDWRAASGRASPHEISLVLRLGSRLARIGGWLIAREGGAPQDRVEAVAALEGARHGGLDRGTDIGPMAEIAARVDRLADRALRLGGLLDQLPDTPSGRRFADEVPGWTPDAMQSPEDGAKVLPFRSASTPAE